MRKLNSRHFKEIISSKEVAQTKPTKNEEAQASTPIEISFEKSVSDFSESEKNEIEKNLYDDYQMSVKDEDSDGQMPKDVEFVDHGEDGEEEEGVDGKKSWSAGEGEGAEVVEFESMKEVRALGVMMLV